MFEHVKTCFLQLALVPAISLSSSSSSISIVIVATTCTNKNLNLNRGQHIDNCNLCDNHWLFDHFTDASTSCHVGAMNNHSCKPFFLNSLAFTSNHSLFDNATLATIHFVKIRVRIPTPRICVNMNFESGRFLT
jgi:hypothetical protein